MDIRVRPTIYVVYIKGKENIYFPFFYAQKYYINSTIPSVLETTSDIPTGPINWSAFTSPLNSIFKLSTTYPTGWKLVLVNGVIAQKQAI